jgi:hypothetical protein
VTLLLSFDEASFRLPILLLVHLYVSFSVFSSNVAFENIFDLLVNVSPQLSTRVRALALS